MMPPCNCTTLSESDSDLDDAITREEVNGTASDYKSELQPAASESDVKAPTQRNACRLTSAQVTELMAPKSQAASPPQAAQESSSSSRSSNRRFIGRDGLGAYTSYPRSWPSNVVIYFNVSFVAIHDLYPKSSIHTLLLPRLPRSRLHPFQAFEDPQFLEAVQKETWQLKKVVAKELQRRYGKYSETDKKREAILNGDVEWDEPELPEGRDWAREVLIGIHAHPSMNDLHIHVLSRDMHSPTLKHVKHYNSFNTPFLIDVADFPLAQDDPRRHPTHAGYLKKELQCWRCGKKFGRKVQLLKDHLAQEFEVWKKE